MDVIFILLLTLSDTLKTQDLHNVLKTFYIIEFLPLTVSGGTDFPLLGYTAERWYLSRDLGKQQF
jgi:hypothetical protein